MSSPLRIEIDGASYTAGDTIRGTVHVVEALDRNESLTVAAEYFGRRLSAQRAVELCLHRGPLPGPRSFPFELTLPYDAPFSFAGHAHDVSWRVKAAADVPWAIDPSAAREITVAPRVIDDSAGPIASVMAVPERPKPAQGGVLTAVLAVVLGILVVAVFLALLPIVLIVLLQQRMLNTRLKGFAVTVPERRFALGEWVPVVVRFHLKRPIDVESLTLTFRGTEQWTTGSGKNSSTHYHHFHAEEVVPLTDTVLSTWPSDAVTVGGRGVYRSAGVSRGGDPIFEWRTALRLPASGLPAVGDSTVYYNVSAAMKIRGWPDPSASTKLKTVSARLATEPPYPESPPVTETSPGIVFVRPNEAAPPGVSLQTTGAGAVWAWIGVVTFGVALIGAGFAALRTLSTVSVEVMVAVGVAVLVAGCVGVHRELSG